MEGSVSTISSLEKYISVVAHANEVFDHANVILVETYSTDQRDSLHKAFVNNIRAYVRAISVDAKDYERISECRKNMFNSCLKTLDIYRVINSESSRWYKYSPSVAEATRNEIREMCANLAMCS